MASSARHPLLHLRRRGHRGGAIQQHRSIWRLHFPMQRLLMGGVMALGFTLLLALAQDLVSSQWINATLWWLSSLGLPGHFSQPIGVDGTALLSMSVPLVEPLLPENGQRVLAVHALVVVAVWVASGWLPDAGRPATYLLRFAAMIHACSVIYFYGWPALFAHSAASHIAAGMRQNWLLMLLTPWLHLCTFYVFPFAWWHKLALTGLTLLWLALLTPIQYALHAAVLSVFGVVAMPLLYLLFGVMLTILGMVALYGWGMSWHDPAAAVESGG